MCRIRVLHVAVSLVVYTSPARAANATDHPVRQVNPSPLALVDDSNDNEAGLRAEKEKQQLADLWDSAARWLPDILLVTKKFSEARIT